MSMSYNGAVCIYASFQFPRTGFDFFDEILPHDLKRNGTHMIFFVSVVIIRSSIVAHIHMNENGE